MKQESQNQSRTKFLTLPLAVIRGAIFGLFIGISIAVTYGYFLLSAARDTLIENGNGLKVGSWTYYLYQYIAYKISHLPDALFGVLSLFWSGSDGLTWAGGMWNLDMSVYGKASVQYWMLQNESRAYSIVEISVAVCVLLAIYIHIMYPTSQSKIAEDSDED